MSDCYIYGLFHEKPSNNHIPQVFYIGRGSDRRMRKHFTKYSLENTRNPHKTNIIKKCQRNDWKVYPRKIWDKLTLEDAKEAEEFILQDLEIFENLSNLSQSCHGGCDKKGDEWSHSKLTNDEVKCIKWLIQNKSFDQSKIADYYNVSEQTLSCIKTERNWSHIEAEKPDNIPDIKKSDYHVTKREKSEVKWLLNNRKLPQKKIAAQYDFSVSPVSEISSNPSKYKELRPKKPDDVPEGKKQTNFLLKKEVSKIKWLSQNTKFTSKSIGKEFNICHETVREIRDDKIHKKVDASKPDEIPDLKKTRLLSKEEVRKIKWYVKNTDLSQSEIGSKFNCDRKTVGSIKLERIEKHKDVKPLNPNH